MNPETEIIGVAGGLPYETSLKLSSEPDGFRCKAVVAVNRFNREIRLTWTVGDRLMPPPAIDAELNRDGKYSVIAESTEQAREIARRWLLQALEDYNYAVATARELRTPPDE